MARPKGVTAQFGTVAEEMAASVQIESGIPIPAGNKYGHWTLIAEKMNVGNSVLLKDDENGKATQKALGLKSALRKTGKDCVSRSMDGGVRVWCTKAPKKTNGKDSPEPTSPPVSGTT